MEPCDLIERIRKIRQERMILYLELSKDKLAKEKEIQKPVETYYKKYDTIKDIIDRCGCGGRCDDCERLID